MSYIMMGAEHLYQHNEYLIALVLFIALVLTARVGYLCGRRRETSSGDGRSQLSILQSSILGILALLLGFTFSMAISRYDLRVNLVVLESNAIGTTYLRSKLLPERQSLADMLRRYVDLRLEQYSEGTAYKDLSIGDTEERELQNRLWSAAVSSGQQDSHSIPVGLFITTLNEMIDLQARRDAARRNHVPETALVLLMVVAAFAIGLIGFGYGWGDQRHLGEVLVISAVVTLVILIIVDLDRPRRGFIQVSQSPMIALAENLRSDANKN